jgi:hypothetical protein
VRTDFKQEGTLSSHYVKPNRPGEPSQYSFTCDSGYELKNGDSNVTCNNGILSGRKPICEKIGKKHIFVTLHYFFLK